MYDNLARVICQNSLDGKDEDTEEPVIVKFTTEDIEISSNEAIYLSGGPWKKVQQLEQDSLVENQELHYLLTRYHDYGGMVI